MRLGRRRFLQLVAPSLMVPGTALRVGAQAAEDALFLLVDGIGPATPADRLHAFLDPLIAADVALAVVLTPRGDPAGSWAGATVLRDLLAADPARVEPVLAIPGLADLPAYFQRRTASEGMRWLRDIAGGAVGQPAPVVTLATEAADPASFDALRCLGVRSVLNLAGDLPVVSSGCARLAVCMTGAARVDIARTADPVAAIRTALDRPGWVQCVLGLEGLAEISLAETRLRGQRSADAIQRELARDRRFLALPRDNALWVGHDQPRHVALRLASAPDAEAAAALAADLRALGLPFSQTLAPLGGAAIDWPSGTCADLSASAGDWSGRHGASLCATADGPMGAMAPELAAALDVLLLPEAGAAFDDRGLLTRGETALSEAERLLQDPNRMRDAILSIRPEDHLTPAARQATLALLRRLRDDPGTRLHDVPGFLRATVSPDRVFDHLRDARRDPEAAEDPESLSDAELRADAALAWSYFERFSNPVTGLCADTADVQGNEEWLHRQLTMWDLGSQIAAVMAAHELGLIDDADFVARADLLVRALPVTRIAGRLLPGEVISTETGRSLSTDFNACDTGRLLSVLRELDAHPLTLRISAERAGQWDLGSVILGGRVHSVVRGALVDRSGSHCAHYTARAFRSRGQDVTSPYEDPAGGSWTDRGMRLLQALRGMGGLGAEPLLLEGVEMGLSEPSDQLAAVLHAAQRLEFDRSGRMYCVSEAPLNRAPWFTYQGLNIHAETDRWAVSVPSSDPRFNTPEFRREIALVNTKAAYLWTACRPGPFSTRLARHVRSRAGQEGIGFSPGVLMATGEALAGYADINTNGIVLEAVAFILRGRKPRLGG